MGTWGKNGHGSQVCEPCSKQSVIPLSWLVNWYSQFMDYDKYPYTNGSRLPELTINQLITRNFRTTTPVNQPLLHLELSMATTSGRHRVFRCQSHGCVCHSNEARMWSVGWLDIVRIHVEVTFTFPKFKQGLHVSHLASMVTSLDMLWKHVTYRKLKRNTDAPRRETLCQPESAWACNKFTKFCQVVARENDLGVAGSDGLQKAIVISKHWREAKAINRLKSMWRLTRFALYEYCFQTTRCLDNTLCTLARITLANHHCFKSKARGKFEVNFFHVVAFLISSTRQFFPSGLEMHAQFLFRLLNFFFVLGGDGAQEPWAPH